MIIGSNIVKASDERPARRDGTCFYCSQPLGSEHQAGCVILSRTVVVKFEIEAVVSVPRDWDQSMVEFKYNDGTWCANNLIDDLTNWRERADADPNAPCACGGQSATYLREAEKTDHEGLPTLFREGD